MSEPSDLELVFLSRQGNKAAFSQLVSRYQPMAQHLATQAIGNGDLAQELVQDAMLQAYLSLEKLNEPTRFKSWLCGIVLNICRNNLRRRKLICFSLEAMIGTLSEEPLIAGSSSDPQIVVEQEELRTFCEKQSILCLQKIVQQYYCSTTSSSAYKKWQTA